MRKWSTMYLNNTPNVFIPSLHINLMENKNILVCLYKQYDNPWLYSLHFTAVCIWSTGFCLSTEAHTYPNQLLQKYNEYYDCLLIYSLYLLVCALLFCKLLRCFTVHKAQWCCLFHHWRFLKPLKREA